MISNEAIKNLLGITEDVALSEKDMVKQLVVTFYPKYNKTTTSETIKKYAERLESAFKELGVKIIPYADAIEKQSIKKVIIRFLKIILNNIFYFFKNKTQKEKTVFIPTRLLPLVLKRKRLKKGITMVVLGDLQEHDLPLQYIRSFKDNSIITIVDFPENISDISEFDEHYKTALNLFVYHMTNIIFAVKEDKWMVYNFNASHPTFVYDPATFSQNVLKAIVPKVVAPIRPFKLKEFLVSKEGFNYEDKKEIIESLISGAKKFSNTKLYPPQVHLDSLPFRNSFFKYIGKLHLDERSGMSFGFLAKQEPVKLSPLISFEILKDKLPSDILNKNKDYVFLDGELYIVIEIKKETFCIKIPPLWVISQRSGSDKVNPKKEDIVRLGIDKGKLLLEAPSGVVISSEYKPSFDTQVILAHALGNFIVGSISKHFSLNQLFVNSIEKNGLGICHWHGYINPKKIQPETMTYGFSNPHVSCSSPQSAVYALDGKLRTFYNFFEENKEYTGDIHVEPHHGSNVITIDIEGLANQILNDPDMTKLGNSFLYLYT